jgi:hypothetical protein
MIDYYPHQLSISLDLIDEDEEQRRRDVADKKKKGKGAPKKAKSAGKQSLTYISSAGFIVVSIADSRRAQRKR